MKNLILISLMISFLVPAFAQTLSGNFENTSMDLSRFPPDGWVDLTVSEFEGVTLGIARKEAKIGIVKIDPYKRVITEGAGIFAGNEKHKWPSAKVLLVTYDGENYKDMGISASCTNVYYEGIVLNEQISIMNTDGTITKYYVAKPILGKFDNFSGNIEDSNFPSNSEKDFSDGYFVSEKYGQLKVLIVSSIQNVKLIFVIDKSPTPDDKMVNTNKKFLYYLLSPMGLIAGSIIILIFLGILLLRSRKKSIKNE